MCSVVSIRRICGVIGTSDIKVMTGVKRSGKSKLLEAFKSYVQKNIPKKYTDTLISNKDKINHKTVGSYLQYLCNAFAFYKVCRYDIKGKKYLMSNDKYYLSDHTFRYAKLGTKNLDNGRVIENIVAIELLRCGY